MMGPFEIVTMERRHLPAVGEAGMAFFAESNLAGKLTVDVEGYMALLESHLGNPFTRSILAMDGERVVGYIHIYCQTEYTVEPVGEMFQFFVRPEWRGSGVSRALVAAAMRQYEEWGCRRCYADAAPGISDPRHLSLFSNLFAKFGYKPVGVAFMKDMP